MESSDGTTEPSDSSHALQQQVNNIRATLAEQEKKLVATLPALQPDLEELRSTAPDADGAPTIPLKIIRLKNNTTNKPGPLILLFHGGGFFSGSPEQLTRPAREFAEEFNAVVILASYRMSPEHPFPTPVFDGWHLANWVLENSFGADPASGGFVVGGFSAGGQLAAVICERAKERPLRFPITGCFLCIASMLHEAIIPEQYRHLWKSRTENANEQQGPKSIEFWYEVFKPDPHSPWFSPFNAPNLKGLPPTYIQVGGLDIFRDDCIVYAKALEDSGVPVRIDIHEKMAHGAYTIWAQGEGDHNLPELRSRTMDGMQWLLNGSLS